MDFKNMTVQELAEYIKEQAHEEFEGYKRMVRLEGIEWIFSHAWTINQMATALEVIDDNIGSGCYNKAELIVFAQHASEGSLVSEIAQWDDTDVVYENMMNILDIMAGHH